jgi:hypothetical protein
VALLTTFWAGAGVELWAKLDAEKVIPPTNSGCEETTTLTFPRHPGVETVDQ